MSTLQIYAEQDPASRLELIRGKAESQGQRCQYLGEKKGVHGLKGLSFAAFERWAAACYSRNEGAFWAMARTRAANSSCPKSAAQRPNSSICRTERSMDSGEG